MPRKYIADRKETERKRQNSRTYKLSPKARKLPSSISTEGSSFMIESGNKDIYIVCGATDMRKGVDGLAAIVNLSLACDLSGASMFIFCNKSRNRVKIIEWDGDGFWLYQKRLERGTFPWPAEGNLRRMVITKDEFSCLFSGTKLRRRLSMDEVFPEVTA